MTSDPLAPYLREQIGNILDGVRGLGEERGAVHAARVAIRRLRSVLRVFGPQLDADRVGAADDDLRWFAGLLGEVRDRQMQRARFGAALDGLPADLVVGRVAERIEATLSAEQDVHEGELVRAMAGERYLRLRERLEDWLRAPPVGASSARALRKRARKAAATADRRLHAACADGGDLAMHRARKAAKRARYAAELLRPLGHGKKQERRHKLVQRVLGDLQDSVVAAGTLRRLADEDATGHGGFTLGLLYARERRAAERLRRRACGRLG